MEFVRFVVIVILLAPLGVGAQNPAPTPAPPPAQPPPSPDQWADLPRYRDVNARLAPPAAGEKRVVFFGDSITEAWASDKTFFPGKGYIGRGISGQTTTQMLVRFRQDVIQLKPAVVVILAGTNDIAENLGPTSLGSIEDNLQSMAELAKANGIQPILCSILPTLDYPWHRWLNPPPKIAEVNKWMENYCVENHLVYCNYYPALVNAEQGMRSELSVDGIHPNSAGFAIMAPMVEDAISKALQGN